ncbi:beta-phosphoglucomutase [Siphonobacter sp. BAB-5405]|uniref:beta-phosphoglucomutase n=1 Tax=Siphonobacter sp. BAB-5405 TaxID=1864825 RepID=UPI000C80B013|nr:beta-phosphoglucomutase [Siphonobacter sp. BAB-5405]PMD98837.1 beta-phosphoglucomutase [Siphonobacter sp. BAB-5405]
MALKACLFDLDGVIVDTAVYHFKAWRRLANELGFDFTEHQNEQLKGVSRMESLELILQWGGVTLSDEEKQQWAARKNEWYLAYVNQMTPQEVLPGVRDFLDSLRKAGIGIALGSASKNARLILERIDMLDAFDAIIDGTHTTKSKPDPEVFLLGAQALHQSPADCVVFEDAVAGIEAAHRGGMKAVGVGSPEVLTEADVVITAFTETSWTKLSDELLGWQ